MHLPTVRVKKAAATFEVPPAAPTLADVAAESRANALQRNDSTASVASSPSTGSRGDRKKSAKSKSKQMNAAVAPQTDAEQGLEKEAILLNRWLEAHTAGHYDLDPTKLAGLDERWSARPLDEAHVIELMNSFRSSGTVNVKVEGVVTNTALYNVYKDSLKQGNPIPLDSLYKSDIRVPIGSHTTAACVKLKELFPKNPLWGVLKKRRVLLCPDDEETLYVTHLRKHSHKHAH